MKFTKMSLAAALLVAGSTSAFAIENIKTSGDARLYYQTTDTQAGYAALSGKDSLFDKDTSSADAAINLNVSADLVKNDLVAVSAGAGLTSMATLGLENNLVSNVWGGAHGATAGTTANYGSPLGGAKVENATWMNEAWIAAKAGNTTAKLGRMELDTPLAFTEKWSIEKNTFEAIAVINTDIPDTTLVGAYVGNGNGNEAFGQDERGIVQDGTVGQILIGQDVSLASAAVVNQDGKFTTFGTNGAYAAGFINNSFKPLKVQGWYYNLISLADAYWLEADLDMDGILVGAQYTSVKVGDNDASGTYAVMAGYKTTKKDAKGKEQQVAKIAVAYSQTSDKGDLHGANVATGTGASKLYTEAWWNYGQVTVADTTAYNVTAEYSAENIADFGLYYTYANHDKAVSPRDLTEVTATATKEFGPLEATLAYIYTDLGKNTDAFNTVQAYLTLKF